MIKILFFIEELEAGGAEKVLRDLVNHMDQTKFDITVQTVWPCDASKFLVPGIQYKTTYSAKNRINQLRYRAEAEAGILYHLHIKDDYDIECAYLEMGPTKVLASSTNKKAKKLAWVHCDLQKKITDPAAFRAKAEKWYRSYDAIVCVSENVRESFCGLFGNDRPAVVLPNVVDDEAIRRKAEDLLPGEIFKRKLTVASLGRLTRQKGFDILLKAHQRLIGEGFDYDLWIGGEGEDRAQLEQFIRENHLEDTVKLPGYLQNPYPLLASADLLVCSSRYEGLSTFATEGLILGKPLVTTDCTGMRELLGDSEYGLVVDNDEEALCQGMRQMLTNASMREQYAKKAALRGLFFSAEKLTAKAEVYFEQLVGETH